MQTVCDVCGSEFYVDNIEERFETMGDGRYVQVMYFTCPDCGADYVVSVFDGKSTKLRDRWLSAQTRCRENMNAKLYKKTLDETAREWNNMKKHNDRLRNRYLREHHAED